MTSFLHHPYRQVMLCLLVAMSLGLYITWMAPTSIYAQQDTPLDIVVQWLTVYPENLEKAAELSTEKSRGGMTKNEWIATQELALHSIELTYLRATIVSEHLVSEDFAQVVIDARMRRIVGEQNQRELYNLRRDEQGRWLIDDVLEYDEKYVGFQL